MMAAPVSHALAAAAPTACSISAWFEMNLDNTETLKTFYARLDGMQGKLTQAIHAALARAGKP